MKCETCLYNKNCQFLAKHKKAEVTGCTAYENAAEYTRVVHSAWNENKYPFCNVCPVCGLVIDRTCVQMHSGRLNYCANCGAIMDGGSKNEIK